MKAIPKIILRHPFTIRIDEKNDNKVLFFLYMNKKYTTHDTYIFTHVHQHSIDKI